MTSYSLSIVTIALSLLVFEILHNECAKTHFCSPPLRPCMHRNHLEISQWSLDVKILVMGKQCLIMTKLLQDTNSKLYQCY